MSTFVMHCFILLKSGHYKVIVHHYALRTSFEIGSGFATKFVMCGRFSGVSCGHFGDIWRGILMKA